MAEADRASEEGETARTSEGGLVIRVQLRGLQPPPHTKTAGAERMSAQRALTAALTRRTGATYSRLVDPISD